MTSRDCLRGSSSSWWTGRRERIGRDILLDHPGDIHGLIGADNFVDTIASTSPFLEGHLPALLIGADTLFLDVITAPGLPAF